MPKDDDRFAEAPAELHAPLTAPKSNELPTIEEHAAAKQLDPALFAAVCAYFTAQSAVDARNNAKTKAAAWASGKRMSESDFDAALKTFNERQYGEALPDGFEPDPKAKG